VADQLTAAVRTRCCWTQSRLSDRILTIDARVVHIAMRHLTYPRNRAGERRCRGMGRGATSGYVERSFWQISGKDLRVIVVLIRLMLDRLIPADGFQSSG
jgi:hypothetical protein